jgi:Diacylglycerol kinase catalytic domain
VYAISVHCCQSHCALEHGYCGDWQCAVQEIKRANIEPAPAVGIIPLGTGNDMSRAFGWGAVFKMQWIKGHDALHSTLRRIADAQPTPLDRWELRMKGPNPESFNRALPPTFSPVDGGDAEVCSCILSMRAIAHEQQVPVNSNVSQHVHMYTSTLGNALVCLDQEMPICRKLTTLRRFLGTISPSAWTRRRCTALTACDKRSRTSRQEATSTSARRAR